jgi:hypothetical protein
VEAAAAAIAAAAVAEGISCFHAGVGGAIEIIAAGFYAG